LGHHVPGNNGDNLLKKYILIFFLIVSAGILIFYNPLFELALLSSRSELYSHFFFIPLVSVFFIITERKEVLNRTGYSLNPGVFFMSAGLVAYGLGLLFLNTLEKNDFLSICTFGFVLWIIGGFILSFGYQPFRKTPFPLLFLFFMVPIPSFILDPVISVLQVWSAHSVQLIFELINFSYLRDGMFFEVPGGIAIEVARQCSGIRSSLALLITSVIAGYMFLENRWSRLILALFVLPVTIFKNALRITSLTLLASYFDESWLTDSWLHKSGGIVYFSIALCVLGSALLALKWFERKKIFPRSENSTQAP
jgi:exosortase